MTTEDCCTCKAGRVLEEYRPFGIGNSDEQNEELVDRWLGRDGYPEQPLRELTKKINRQIVRHHYEENGRTVSNHIVKQECDLLTADDDCDDRHGLVFELEQQGISPEKICSEMIGSSTLHRHLTECLDVEKGRKRGDPNNWSDDKLEYARKVSRENTRYALQALDRAGDLPGGERANVSVAIHVECPECGSTSRLRRVRSRGSICSQCDLSTDESDTATESVADD